MDVHVTRELVPVVVHDEHQPFGRVQDTRLRDLMAAGIYPLTCFLEAAHCLNIEVLLDVKINTVPVAATFEALVLALDGQFVQVASFSRGFVDLWPGSFLNVWHIPRDKDPLTGAGVICPVDEFEADRASAYQGYGYRVGVFGGTHEQADFSIQ